MDLTFHDTACDHSKRRSPIDAGLSSRGDGVEMGEIVIEAD